MRARYKPLYGAKRRQAQGVKSPLSLYFPEDFSLWRRYVALQGDTIMRKEEAAFRIAWAAVKRQYEKIGDQWVEKR
jgi:ChaB